MMTTCRGHSGVLLVPHCSHGDGKCGPAGFHDHETHLFSMHRRPGIGEMLLGKAAPEEASQYASKAVSGGHSHYALMSNVAAVIPTVTSNLPLM